VHSISFSCYAEEVRRGVSVYELWVQAGNTEEEFGKRIAEFEDVEGMNGGQVRYGGMSGIYQSNSDGWWVGNTYIYVKEGMGEFTGKMRAFLD